MLQIVQNYKSGAIRLEEVPDAKVKPGYLLVRNAFSVVSIGTEMMKVRAGKKSMLGKARERPDQVKLVIDHIRKAGIADAYKRVMNKLDRLTPLGYSSAGIVVEVGEAVTGFKVGDRVACAGSGHAELVTVPKNLCALVPEEVGLDSAAFTTLGAIAMHGVRQADVRLGDSVAVVGVGLVGQIVCKILLAAGCRVVGIDVDKSKLTLAKESGVDLTVPRTHRGLATTIQNFSSGYGVDAVIVTASTSSNDPIEFAPKILRDRGRLVVLGITKMDLPWRTYYEKEIEVRLSRSYGPGRYDAVYEDSGVDYPIGYVRWTQNRNMRSFLELIARKKLSLDNILTHRFKFSEADSVYESMNENRIQAPLGVLFEYDGTKTKSAQAKSPKQPAEKARKATWPSADQKMDIGMIGAGNYARNTILPIIRNNPKLVLKTIVTETGISSRDAKDNFGFASCESEVSSIFDDTGVQTVVVATRHDTHAEMVIGALRAGKHVFVEKPLALSCEELEQVLRAARETDALFMVGLNRRFSSPIRQIREFFEHRQGPLALNYRVNAGMIPDTHWYQDPKKGGGRIIGEGAHFVDVIQFISGEKPVRVYAESFSTGNKALQNDDTANLSVKFSGGSIATINYYSCGDSTYPKERLEVLGEDSIAVMDDFKVLELVRDGKKSVIKSRIQDKGHKEELRLFFESIYAGGPGPISVEEMKNATLVTIAATESFRTGKPIGI